MTMNMRTMICPLAASLLLMMICSSALAQSEGASDVSIAPVALSVLAPASVLVAGTVLTVKSVQASAHGTTIVLKGAANASETTIEVSADLASKSATVVGKAATVSVIASGTIISAGTEVLAFIPSEIARDLLHSKKLTR
jgi:hypothetical protein